MNYKIEKKCHEYVITEGNSKTSFMKNHSGRSFENMIIFNCEIGDEELEEEIGIDEKTVIIAVYEWLKKEGKI